MKSQFGIKEYFTFFANDEALFVIKMTYFKLIDLFSKVEVETLCIVVDRCKKGTRLVVLGVLYEGIVTIC
jgi:hypothetical protein